MSGKAKVISERRISVRKLDGPMAGVEICFRRPFRARAGDVVDVRWDGFSDHATIVVSRPDAKPSEEPGK